MLSNLKVLPALAALAFTFALQTSSRAQDSMKHGDSGHSAFRIEAGAAKILIDPFLSDNPSWDKGWSGYLAVFVLLTPR